MENSTTVSMKLLIDTSKTRRVLFAEAGKDCVDFLFHVLSLPVATIILLLRAEGMGGSLPNVYKSLENLDDDYIQFDQNKDTFLKPAAPVSSCSIPLLALETASVEKKFYRCPRNSCQSYISDDPRAICPLHSRKMNTNVKYVTPPAQQVASEDGGLVKGVVTYMVMDDLEVTPMSSISNLTLLNKFNVNDVGALEEKVVNLGIKEAMKLLKTSLESNNVLTNVFC